MIDSIQTFLSFYLNTKGKIKLTAYAINLCKQ